MYYYVLYVISASSLCLLLHEFVFLGRRPYIT